MSRLLAASTIVAMLIAVSVLIGCDGGGGVGPPPPAPDTATVRGTVVQADNPAVGLAGAEVQARNALGEVLVQTTAGAGGAFVLRDIPVGDITLFVDTGNEAQYGAQTVRGLHLDRDDDLNLTITVLRVGTAAPTIIYLTPTQATVDVRGQVDFNATVASSGGALAVTPTFLLSAPIGVVDRTGRFLATQEGEGQLIAVCGDVRATARITVVGPRAPLVTTYIVSPTRLRARGGNITITVAAEDGDGVASVVAQIFKPDSSQENRVLPLDPQTTSTYRTTYNIPANNNPYDALGHQPEQRYSIRVVVTDNSSATTTTNFVDVVVAGLDAPPPPN